MTLAYALSWAWLVALLAAGRTVVAGRGWPTHVPALLGPAVAAVICTALSGRSVLLDLRRRLLRWRIGWRWWLAATSPAMALAVVLGALVVLGVDVPPASAFAEFSGLPAVWGVPGVAAALVLVNGMGEETGWRGYLQPSLQHRMGPVAATGVVALIWAGWHLPQFFVTQTYQAFPVAMLPVFLVGLAGGAVVLTWLWNRTRSVVACATWHGLYNLAGATTAAGMHSGVVAAAVWTYVVGFAVVLLFQDRRAVRTGRQSVLAP